MNNTEYAAMMYATGVSDGQAHLTPKYEDEPEYAVGYAVGEGK